MKVKELIEKLKGYEELEVFQAIDAEGNGFLKFDDFEVAIVDKVSEQYERYLDEIFYKDWTAKEAGKEDEEWKQFIENETKEIIVFWPQHP